tara:strand:- start:49 stop:225 length:177 start_codon:yes stop_codon:yes gene_type:complete
MIFLILILFFGFELIKAISSLIGEQKRHKRVWGKLEKFENQDEKMKNKFKSSDENHKI